MPQDSKTDLYAAIRRDYRAGATKRALMRRYNVGWATATRALESAWPRPRKPMAPRRTRLDPFTLAIDAMLRADLDAPRKQRHTATRIFQRLLEEYGARDVSYSMVQRYVSRRRPQIQAAAGAAAAEAFIVQPHPPGLEAEVDFGDVKVWLNGELVTCYLFAFRLSYSGKSVHRPIDRTNGVSCMRLAG